jgi:enterochelin esterase-like enzyme/drug/metabolite transporter (DMT)-like permease
MRKLALQLAGLAAAAAVVVVGISGAYGYAHDYDLHRGFSTLVQLPRAGTGRLQDVNFYSSALRRNADYLVYLPPRYSSARRYPVYYLLHGMPGQPRVFVNIANMDVRLDNQLSLGHARPMILVYPDGRIGGSVFSDSEWANTSSGAFESYVLEVMDDVDRHFATLARRQDRVIAGFSAGAYGAINIALHHLADFADVQTWSGYFAQTRTGVFAHATDAQLAYNSPIDYVRRHRPALSAHPLRVYMFVGRDDSASRGQQSMIRALRAGGAQVDYNIYPGGHDWSVWYPRLNQMLDLASQDAAHPLLRATAPPFLGYTAAPPPAAAAGGHRHHGSELRLIGALLLALLSAALINVGFVLQHRGHSRALAGGRTGLPAAFREPTWLTGQVVGWIGFAGQIVAVALAPLTLVQAFSAGSLALSVPLAAFIFGHRISRQQLVAIAIIAVSLASLPIGFAGGHGHLHSGVLIAAALMVMLVASLLVPTGGIVTRAIAAGALYGAADASIKAASVAVHVHGASGLVSGWTVLAGLCTVGGFLAFQAALRDGDAVQPLTLMNAFTAVAAVALGMAAFGEALGTTPAAGAAHGLAIALVLACVRPLAGAQQRLAGVASPAALSDGPPGLAARTDRRTVVARRAVSRVPRTLARLLFGGLVLMSCSLIAIGLLYTLRQLRWLAFGPAIPDALPLLQLAGFAGQPLARVVVAGLVAGAVLGLALTRVSRPRRLFLAAVLAPLLLLAASDASYAVARNLPLDHVLLDQAPGVGPWLEGLLLAAGSVLVAERSNLGAGTLLSRACVRAGARRRHARAVRPIVGERWLVATPLLAAGFTLAVLATFVLPRVHARQQVKVASPAASTQPTPGTLFIVHFYSEALGKRADYLVYLPREYSPSRHLPVFYMLHGMPGRPLAFTVNAGVEPKLERLIQTHRVKPMILVFPDGRIDGRTHTDSEWANTRSGRFESYVVDVVHDVDSRFATLPYRRDRAIAGLSAGAYGAANVGLHQVTLFGLIQVWSGYFTQTRTGVFARATPAQLAYNSPIDYARTMRGALRRHRLRVFIYVGRGDSDHDQVAPMAAVLRAEGADVHYAIYSGGHSWKLWSPRVDQMLIMASRGFAAAPRFSRSR